MPSGLSRISRNLSRYNKRMSASLSRPDVSSVAERLVAHNVVHLRAEPRSGSELVSQTLLGRTVRVLREQDGWAYVQGDDTYQGWAETRRLAQGGSANTLTPVTAIFADLRTAPIAEASLVMRLPLLCSVAVEAAASQSGWAAVKLPGGNTGGYLRAEALTPLPTIPPDTVGAYAAIRGRDFLGTPYLWGGSSSFGLDCSGFVQLCYRLAGLILRRDADIQANDPRFLPVEKSELQPGDLVFFARAGRIYHVGMQFENNTFLHASGGAGVMISEWGEEQYSPNFVEARRLDPACATEPVTRFEAEDR